jgi:hypothetical protein
MFDNEFTLTRSQKKECLLYIKDELGSGKSHLCCLFMNWIRKKRGKASIIDALQSFDELMDDIYNATHGYIDIDTWLALHHLKPMDQVKNQAQEIRHKIIDKLLKEF